MLLLSPFSTIITGGLVAALMPSGIVIIIHFPLELPIPISILFSLLHLEFLFKSTALIETGKIFFFHFSYYSFSRFSFLSSLIIFYSSFISHHFFFLFFHLSSILLYFSFIFPPPFLILFLAFLIPLCFSFISPSFYLFSFFLSLHWLPSCSSIASG